MKKKMTPEEKEQLQAMLDKQRLLEHKKNMKTLKNIKYSSVVVSAFHDVHLQRREVERRNWSGESGKSGLAKDRDSGR